MGGVAIVIESLLVMLVQSQVTDVTWIERGGIIAVLVVVIYALYAGKVNSAKVVLKEDYDRVVAINASYAEEVIPNLTTAVNDAVAMLRIERQKNGSS